MDGGSAHCATEPADKVSGFRSKVLPLRPKRTTNKKKQRTKVFTHSACEVGVEKKKIDSHLKHRSEDCGSNSTEPRC